jgi:hypothetical protein
MWGFRKKLWTVDKNGNRDLTEAGKRQFDKWAAEGKIERIDVQVHVLDPTRQQPYELTCLIGDEPDRVTREAYERFRDENDHLYMLAHYREGKRETHFIPKSVWSQLAAAWNTGNIREAADAAVRNMLKPR